MNDEVKRTAQDMIGMYDQLTMAQATRGQAKTSTMHRAAEEIRAAQMQAEYTRKLADVASKTMDDRMMEAMWETITPSEPKPLKKFKIKNYK